MWTWSATVDVQRILLTFEQLNAHAVAFCRHQVAATFHPRSNSITRDGRSTSPDARSTRSDGRSTSSDGRSTSIDGHFDIDRRLLRRQLTARPISKRAGDDIERRAGRCRWRGEPASLQEGIDVGLSRKVERGRLSCSRTYAMLPKPPLTHRSPPDKHKGGAHDRFGTTAWCTTQQRAERLC